MLDRNSILAKNDLPRVEVQVPEWGGSVYVRSLTGAERDQVERMITQDKLSRAAIVVMVAVDKDGNQLFTRDDTPALEKKNGYALQRVVDAALDVNLMTIEGLEAGKDS